MLRVGRTTATEEHRCRSAPTAARRTLTSARSAPTAAARLVADAAAPASRRVDRDDQHRRLRALGRSRPTASSTRSTPPRSTRCPLGHGAARRTARTRARAAGSCSTRTSSRAGRHPDSEIFLDDVTVSRRHAEFHREGDTFTVSDVGSLNGTYVNRDRIDTVRAQGQRRGPDRQVPPRLLPGPRGLTRDLDRELPASGRVRMNIGEVLDRLRTDFPGITIPKIRFLEDKGLVKPERTPSGYRKFSVDDVERLRYVLPLQRDHYLPLRGHRRAPRRDRPRPRAAADRAGGADRARRCRWPPTACRASESFRRRDHLRLSRKRAAQDRRDLRGRCSTQLEQFGLVIAAHRHGPLRHRRAGHRHDRPRARRLRLRAAPPARVQDRRRPRGRPGRAGGGPAQARPRHRCACPCRGDRRARSPPCRCACTPPSSRPACTAADHPSPPVGTGVVLTHARGRRPGRPGGDAVEPADRAPARGGGASATCRSGSAPSRPPRSRSPSRASYPRGR